MPRIYAQGPGPRQTSGVKAARSLFVLLAACGLLAGCQPDWMAGEAPAACRETGRQCRLPAGPLGVCERDRCPAGEEPPCFQCTPQH